MKTIQQKIAEVLNVSQPTISKYKQQKLQLRYVDAKKIKQCLGWEDKDIDKFIGLDNERIAS